MHAIKMSKSFVPAHWTDQTDVEQARKWRPSDCTSECAIAWDRSRFHSETTRPMKKEGLSAATYPYHWADMQGRSGAKHRTAGTEGRSSNRKSIQSYFQKLQTPDKVTINCNPFLLILAGHSATQPSQLTCVIPSEAPFAVHLKKLQII
jgi:hypothetical protein